MDTVYDVYRCTYQLTGWAPVEVTLTPSDEAVEQSLTTLRFAQKAAEVRCVVRPVLISKEQSLIVKQREIIKQLHSQVGIYVSMYLCMYAFMYVFMHVCVYACMYLYV